MINLDGAIWTDQIVGIGVLICIEVNQSGGRGRQSCLYKSSSISVECTLNFHGRLCFLALELQHRGRLARLRLASQPCCVMNCSTFKLFALNKVSAPLPCPKLGTPVGIDLATVTFS